MNEITLEFEIKTCVRCPKAGVFIPLEDCMSCQHNRGMVGNAIRCAFVDKEILVRR